MRWTMRTAHSSGTNETRAPQRLSSAPPAQDEGTQHKAMCKAAQAGARSNGGRRGRRGRKEERGDKGDQNLRLLRLLPSQPLFLSSAQQTDRAQRRKTEG